MEIHADLGAERNSPAPPIQLEVSRTKYDRDTKRIGVRLKVVSGKAGGIPEGKGDPWPYEVSVVLHGTFEVDETRFKVEMVEEWAQTNAPLVLYPYARETIFSMTGRVGFTEAILPLLEIPTFRIVAPT